MDMNCNTVMALMRSYFNYPISTEIKDAILTHLVTCERCRTVYMDYARANGTKFELEAEIEAVYEEYEERDRKKEAKKSMDNKQEQKRRTFYSMATEKDISSLMNVQCVRDYFKETIDVQDKEFIKKASDFAWYVTEKMCKNIDTLEELYRLSGEDNNGEDSAKA